MAFTVERLENPGGPELLPLVEESTAEGFDFLTRLIDEHASRANRFDRAGEAFFGARDEHGRLIAVGGLNQDPFQSDPGVGRLRRVYVKPAWRRRGVARQLVQTVIDTARGHFRLLRLRSTPEAMEFYHSMGFGRLRTEKNVSHVYPFGPMAQHLRDLQLGPVTLCQLNLELPCLILDIQTATGQMRRLRQCLPEGWLAFLGDYHEINQWHPQRRIVPQRELVIGPGTHPYDSLRLCGTSVSDRLLQKLDDWDRRFGIEITIADRNGMAFNLLNLPKDLTAFVEELYDVCPDPVDVGYRGTKENWAEELSRDPEVYLHW